MSRLEKFLMNRGLLKQFEYNVLHYPTKFISSRKTKKSLNLNQYQNINYYFLWANTKEGYWFWEKIYYEFEKCLKNEML